MDHQQRDKIAPDDVTEDLVREATSPTGSEERESEPSVGEEGGREAAEEDARQGTQG
jgi:hypothetical protein